MANRSDIAPSEAVGYHRLNPQHSTVLSPSPAAAVSSVRDPREPPVSTTTTFSEHESTTMMDIDKNSAAEDRRQRATSVLSMDDIEAAQALEGLRSGKDQADPAGVECFQHKKNSISNLYIHRVWTISSTITTGATSVHHRTYNYRNPAAGAAVIPPHLDSSLSLLRDQGFDVGLYHIEVIFSSV